MKIKKTKASLRPKPAKKVKPEPRSLEHKFFGVGSLVGVFTTDSGLVVDMDFGAGRRTVLLDAEFWIGDISDVLAIPPQPRSLVKEKPAKAAPVADEIEEPELMPDDAGHFGEVADSEESESEGGAEHDAELVSADQ
jgi:hypothetical protein